MNVYPRVRLFQKVSVREVQLGQPNADRINSNATTGGEEKVEVIHEEEKEDKLAVEKQSHNRRPRVCKPLRAPRNRHHSSLGAECRVQSADCRGGVGRELTSGFAAVAEIIEFNGSCAFAFAFLGFRNQERAWKSQKRGPSVPSAPKGPLF